MLLIRKKQREGEKWTGMGNAVSLVLGNKQKKEEKKEDRGVKNMAKC